MSDQLHTLCSATGFFVQLKAAFPGALLTFLFSLVVVLIGALAAQIIAHFYQRRSKVMEFRFNALKDAAQVYLKLVEVVTDLSIARRNLQIAENRGESGQLAQRKAQLLERAEVGDRALSKGFELAFVYNVLFSKETQSLWLRMLQVFDTARFGGDESMRALLKPSGDLWAAFFRAAAGEIPMPYAEAQIEDPAIDKAAEEDARAIGKTEE